MSHEAPKTYGQARARSVKPNVIDLTRVSPETLAKVARVEALQARDPDLPLKAHCKRAGISLDWFFRIRRSLRATGGLGLATDEALG
jgi:hypothetical protein